jgi:quinol monooxygenase YgiN
MSKDNKDLRRFLFILGASEKEREKLLNIFEDELQKLGAPSSKESGCLGFTVLLFAGLLSSAAGTCYFIVTVLT